MLVPGTLWKQYHIEVGKLTSELLGLGLLDKGRKRNQTNLLTKYFMHGHRMGLQLMVES
jgi:Xaa-Pro aminopeptidase